MLCGSLQHLDSIVRGDPTTSGLITRSGFLLNIAQRVRKGIQNQSPARRQVARVVYSFQESDGNFRSIRSKTNAASSTAVSTQYCFAKFGLSDSIVSINLRAQSKVAANKIACLRSSVITGLADWCAEEGGEQFTSFSANNVVLLPLDKHLL